MSDQKDESLISKISGVGKDANSEEEKPKALMTDEFVVPFDGCSNGNNAFPRVSYRPSSWGNEPYFYNQDR